MENIFNLFKLCEVYLYIILHELKLPQKRKFRICKLLQISRLNAAQFIIPVIFSLFSLNIF